MTPAGRSFFAEIGVDPARIRDEIADVVIRSIEQVGPAFPALTPLVTQLNADAIIERVDTAIEMIGAAQRQSEAQALDVPHNRPAATGRPPAPVALSTDWVGLLTEAFLNVPAIANDDSRQTVFDMLPNRLRDGIPRSRTPRVQVVQMIRSSANYRGGLSDMLRAIRLVEGDSDPMRRLDGLILRLTGENGDTAELHSPGGAG
jgi:hypothetical protein